jgi:hypothetical protein
MNHGFMWSRLVKKTLDAENLVLLVFKLRRPRVIREI